MSSPSTALLAALVAANARPKRLLIQDRSSPFVSNIGRIAGATPLQVPPGEVDRTLRGLIQSERIGPEHVWAVAIHRDGHLAPAEWLSDCALHGLSTIDVCLGSLSALARQSRKASTFTIVSLDAEESFAGVHLTALLTDDQELKERVGQMCLPGPNVYDYVFDASPRGVSHDEAGLMSLVSRTIARIEAETSVSSTQTSFGGQTGTVEEGRSDSASLVQGKNPWLALLSDDQTRRERQQSAKDEMARRLQITEEELLAQTRRAVDLEASHQTTVDELLRSKAETDRALASTLEEKTSLDAKIAQVGADRDTALAEAAKREATLSSALEEQKARALDLEKAMAAVNTEKELLAAKFAEAEAGRDQILVEAAEREAALKSALDEQSQRALTLEQSTAARSERETSLTDTWETARAQFVAQVNQLDSERLQADEARTEVLAQKTAIEASLASALSERAHLSRELAQAEETRASLGTELTELRRESAALALKNREAEQALLQATQERAREAAAAEGRLAEVETVRDRVLREGAEREARLTSALEEQKQGTLALQNDLASLRDTWKAAQAQMLEQAAELEAQLLEADEARTEFLSQKTVIEAKLISALSERAHFSKGLGEAEETRATLAKKLDELQRESATLALKNREAERALLQATQERAREADGAEGRLAEVRAAAETAMARAVEGWRGRLEGAGQASAALKTALAARASEVAAHERSHAVADAHRRALEDRAAQLQRSLEAIQQKALVPVQPVVAATPVDEPQEEAEQIRAPDRELASWEMPRSRFSGLGENSGDASSVVANDFIDFTAPTEESPDGLQPQRAHEDARLWRGEQSQPTERPRSDFTPEYEQRRSSPDETGAGARGWLRGMANRIRRG